MPRKELTIAEQWKRYLKTRAVEMRNKIVVHYSPLVHTHAARLTRKLPAQVSYDEICSAAFDGLIEALNSVVEMLHGLIVSLGWRDGQELRQMTHQ